jgi:hypothetical protein
MSYLRRTGERALRFTLRTAGRRLRPVLNYTATLPVVGRGFVAAPPDFVGVGVQRAGTSWWHGLIEEHPAVHPLGLAAKELHYFDERWQTGLDDATIRRYHRLFARPGGMVGGEWTPRYMHDAWTPALLRQAAPDARILVVLRDPVARFRSGLVHALERSTPITPDLVDDAIARGMYRQQLERLLRHFSRDRVLILQFERCAADPGPMLRATYEFLGLPGDAYVPPTDALAPVNASRGAHVDIPKALVDEVTRTYQASLAPLAADFPEIDLALWPSTAR